MYNPKIINHGKEINEYREGCLSLDTKHNMKRYNVIDVQYFDKNKYMRNITLKRWNSRVFQHELEHLQGKLIK